MFIIEDDFHAEFISEKFDSFEAAYKELQSVADIPFGVKPNNPPCTSWRNCLRDYHILEYDDSVVPWKRLSDIKVLEVSATGIVWHYKA